MPDQHGWEASTGRGRPHHLRRQSVGSEAPDSHYEGSCTPFGSTTGGIIGGFWGGGPKISGGNFWYYSSETKDNFDLRSPAVISWWVLDGHCYSLMGSTLEAHSILKTEGNLWEEGGLPNLSTSILAPSKVFLRWYSVVLRWNAHSPTQVYGTTPTGCWHPCAPGLSSLVSCQTKDPLRGAIPPLCSSGRGGGLATARSRPEIANLQSAVVTFERNRAAATEAAGPFGAAKRCQLPARETMDKMSSCPVRF